LLRPFHDDSPVSIDRAFAEIFVREQVDEHYFEGITELYRQIDLPKMENESTISDKNFIYNK
jgi:hypothetical protein